VQSVQEARLICFTYGTHRYTEDTCEHLDPTAILGDHVGGSAVRALALVAKVDCYTQAENVSVESNAQSSGKCCELIRDQELLFSAGAKEVLTCWLLDWGRDVEGEELSVNQRAPSSQWLSTHSPERTQSIVAKLGAEVNESMSVAQVDEPDTSRVGKEEVSCSSRSDDGDDDQRYLALTAFGKTSSKTR
jgi:hypothetical protein